LLGCGIKETEMDKPVTVELGFENVDAVKIPIDDVSVRLEGVHKTIDLSCGRYSETLVCDFASIRIPRRTVSKKTAMGFDTLEDHIQFQDFVDISIIDEDGKGTDVYLPWVDGEDEQTNSTQHTYQESGIFGKPIKGYSTKYKDHDVVLFFFDEKVHPEYKELVKRYEGDWVGEDEDTPEVGYTYDGEDGWPDEDVEGRYDGTYDDDTPDAEDDSREDDQKLYSDAIELINKALDELTKKSWELGDK